MRNIEMGGLKMRCSANSPNGLNIQTAIKEHKKHPLVIADGIIGSSGYRDGDYFCVFANGDGNFIDYGIVEGSLVVVDRNLCFQENGLNVIDLAEDATDPPLLKISRTAIDGYPCIGRVFMAVNQYG